MEYWLEMARGPLFRAAVAFLVLGLLRNAILAVWEARAARGRLSANASGERPAGSAPLAAEPTSGGAARLVAHLLTAFVLCAATITVGVFFGGHVALWEAGVGVSWPAIDNAPADVLTAAAIVSAILLFVERAADRELRESSSPADYLVPLVFTAPFVSGFLVMHPAVNPFGYDATMLVHAISADLLLVLVPVAGTRLMAIPPFRQLEYQLVRPLAIDARKAALAFTGRKIVHD